MEEKKNNQVQALDDDMLEDVAGGYGIIHLNNGMKLLVDDNGKKVATFGTKTDAKFFTWDCKSEYHQFDKGLEYETDENGTWRTDY